MKLNRLQRLGMGAALMLPLTSMGLLGDRGGTTPVAAPPSSAAPSQAPLSAIPTACSGTELAQWVARADAIVVARCLRQDARWNADHRLIYTYTTFAVEDWLTGGDAKEITVRTLGGSVGRISQMAVGAVQFRAGEHDVLFLMPSDEPGVFRPVNVMTGKVELTTDPANGQTVVADGAAPCGEALEPPGLPVRPERSAVQTGTPRALIDAHGVAAVTPGQPLAALLKSIRQLRAAGANGGGPCD